MACVFCSVNFEFNTIKYNTINNIQNNAIDLFSILLINAINILIKDNREII
ncbi:hypothetical protein KTC92_04490 [Clostridium sp. CM027]|uniref:hypothetical protein n=1 Tax=Clostridium sp. CM027 TaxID=2849865 RepID=UPI00215B72E3|nr:hypothetical protein [Clostridium sp. CM027]UVE41739.1 hypothetical protein KTC92_04490 [Clostridium sp. CM027]